MKKNFCSVLFLVNFYPILTLRAQDTLLKEANVPSFQVWMSQSTEGRIAKNFSLGLEQGHIIDDIRDYTGSVLLSGVYYHFHKSTCLGAELVVGQGKSGHALWTKSITPRLSLDYEFKIGALPSDVGVTIRHRMIDTVKSRFGFDIAWDVDFVTFDWGSLYLGNRAFYNFNGNDTIDEYHPYIGLEAKINKYLTFDVYYLLECFRSEGKSKWDTINILGLELSASF